VFAQKLNEEYGPLDWRLPEAHAIYWYSLGLEKAKENTGKAKPDAFSLAQLRRGIFQSAQAAFRHGRIIVNPITHEVAQVPDLDLIPKANEVYLKMYAEETDQGQKEEYLTGHRNYLRDAVYWLYENARVAEAAKWFKYLGDKYPDQPIIENRPDSLPKNLTLDEYALAVVNIDIGETSQERVTGAVQGLLENAYLALAIGQDDRYVGFQLLANKAYDRYQSKMGNDQPRAKLPPMNDLKRTVLDYLLGTQTQVIPYAARAAIRTGLRMPAETNAPPQTVSTNAIIPVVSPASTNSSTTNSPTK